MDEKRIKVLLINSPLKLRKKIPLLEFSQEPLAIMYLAGVLTSKGIKVYAKDYEIEKYNPKKLLRLIEKNKIKIVGISCTCASFNSTQKIIQLIKKRLNLKFQLQGRVDSADETLYQKLKHAGCTQITFGIETGVPKFLEFIKKRTNLDDVRNAVRIAKKAGLNTRGNFILGFPGENIQTLWQTIRFAKELQLTRSIFFVLTPYPHSTLWEFAEDNGFIDKNLTWDSFDQFTPHFIKETLSERKFFRHFDYAYIFSATSFLQIIGRLKSHPDKISFIKNYFDFMINKNKIIPKISNLQQV